MMGMKKNCQAGVSGEACCAVLPRFEGRKGCYLPLLSHGYYIFISYNIRLD